PGAIIQCPSPARPNRRVSTRVIFAKRAGPRRDAAGQLGPSSSPRGYFLATMVPPLSVHSLSLFTFTQPCPLQPFSPEQLLFAPARALCPLLLFTPALFTSLLVALFAFPSPACLKPAVNIAQTAEAISAPFTVFFTFLFSFAVLKQR